MTKNVLLSKELTHSISSSIPFKENPICLSKTGYL